MEQVHKDLEDIVKGSEKLFNAKEIKLSLKVPSKSLALYDQKQSELTVDHKPKTNDKKKKEGLHKKTDQATTKLTGDNQNPKKYETLISPITNTLPPGKGDEEAQSFETNHQLQPQPYA